MNSLLTASDVATICEVDLKTIHNWVDRGRIKAFRTPGRHLRFKAPDVVEFLMKQGYPVPTALRAARGAVEPLPREPIAGPCEAEATVVKLVAVLRDVLADLEQPRLCSAEWDNVRRKVRTAIEDVVTPDAAAHNQ